MKYILKPFWSIFIFAWYSFWYLSWMLIWVIVNFLITIWCFDFKHCIGYRNFMDFEWHVDREFIKDSDKDLYAYYDFYYYKTPLDMLIGRVRKEERLMCKINL